MSHLEPGQLFAKDFQVERRLSQGGMGAVYVARQLSTDKRRALKLMHPQLAPDARSRQRFVDEARIGGRIDSEHVVEVVAAGIDEPSGAPWLAMELLDGEDLGSLSHRRGALPPGEVRDVFAQAGHALSLAHEKGIVHRDLKPENLFLARARREGAASVVKVLDFGIAMALPSGGAGVVTTTVGSPFWMAPEQAKPGSTLTPATDVWALGLIAFQLLSGGSYWRTAKQDDASIGAVLTEILVEPMNLASQRAAELGLRAVPEGFDAWFGRCVNREASARFADARSCLAALDELLARVAPRVAVTSGRSNAETAASLQVPAGLEATLQRATPAPPVDVAAPVVSRAAATAASAASGGASSGTPDGATSRSASSGGAPGGASVPGASSAGASSSDASSAGASFVGASSAGASSAGASSSGASSSGASSAGASSAGASSAGASSAGASSGVASPGSSSGAAASSAPAPRPESRSSRLVALVVAVALLIAWRALNRFLDAPDASSLPPPPAPPSFVVAPNVQPNQPLVAPPPPPSPVLEAPVIDAGAPVALPKPVVKKHSPAPPVVPAGPLTADRIAGEHCPGQHVSPAEARANAERLCDLLDPWDIVRLGGGGSMDGRGYQCKVRDHDTRPLGFSLCKR